jgi:hypothetical protein
MKRATWRDVLVENPEHNICSECGHIKALHKRYQMIDAPGQCRGALGTCFCKEFKPLPTMSQT